MMLLEYCESLVGLSSQCLIEQNSAAWNRFNIAGVTKAVGYSVGEVQIEGCYVNVHFVEKTKRGKYYCV